MGYDGIERRIHRVFVTRNTEYHLRRDECVAVRDRRTGAWVASHRALHCRIAGGIAFLDTGGLRTSAGSPEVGQSLFFDHVSLVTSPVLKVERPPREIVSHYERGAA